MKEDFDELGEIDILDGDFDSKYNGTIPGGLLALCILTLVGSSLILLKDFYTYKLYAAANEVKNVFDNGQGEDLINTFFASIKMIYAVEVLSCLVAIAGAILMIKLKKIGFALYVISAILYGAAIIWFWFVAMQLELNEGLIFLLFIYLAAPIGFIIMYASQKKYLH